MRLQITIYAPPMIIVAFGGLDGILGADVIEVIIVGGSMKQSKLVMKVVTNAIKSEILSKICCPNPEVLGLMLGEVGTTLFLAARKNTDLGFIENSVNGIIENISKFKNGSFSNGISGLAFLLSYLKRGNFLTEESDEVLVDIDALVLQNLELFWEDGNFDYLHGYLGIINYLCYSSNDFIRTEKFRNDFNLFYNRVIRLEHPPLTLNLGLAHGIPSVLSILVNLAKATNDSSYKNQISEIIILIRSFRVNNDTGSKYPYTTFSKFDNSRLAWCYGDLGINLSLIKAAKYLDNQELLEQALQDLIGSSKRRELNDVYIIDNSLCHGAAGCVYFYKQLFKEYKLIEFKEASIFWEEFIFNNVEKYGIKGLNYYLETEGWIYEKGILEGLAGIYIALFIDEFDVDVFNYIFLTD